MDIAVKRSLLGEIVYQCVKWPGLLLLAVHEAMVKLAVRDPPFFESSDFAWVKDVERSFPDIQREYLAVAASRGDAVPSIQTISKEQERLTADSRWKMFAMLVYGRRVEPNIAQCPKTFEALERIPGLSGAAFSIMSGPKHIPPHRGPFKGVLRYHLGVVVPHPELCEIRVDKETRRWQEGASLIFDDYYDHEAWNRSDVDRVVLFVDFVRPLPFWARPLNNLIYALLSGSPFVADFVKNATRYAERGARPA